MRSESERALELERNPWTDIIHMDKVIIKPLVSQPVTQLGWVSLPFRHSPAELDIHRSEHSNKDPCLCEAYIPVGTVGKNTNKII